MLGDIVQVTGKIEPGTARYSGCDEFGEALLKFKNGAVGTLAAGWVDVANPVSLLISGTEGHATVFQGTLFFQSSKVQGADGKTPWTALPPALPHPFDLFLDALSGQTGLPLVAPREAAARVAVMEAIYKGAAEKKWLTPKEK